MLNIVWTRIDDRLIHGQVVTAWAKMTRGDRIVVIDDDVAGDAFMSKIIKMAAPESLEFDIYTVEEAVEILKGNDSGERVMILVKTPITIKSLIDKGIAITEVNLGGLGAMKGRKQLCYNVFVSSEEKDCCKELINRGVQITVQMVPDEQPKDIKSLI